MYKATKQTCAVTCSIGKKTIYEKPAKYNSVGGNILSLLLLFVICIIEVEK